VQLKHEVLTFMSNRLLQKNPVKQSWVKPTIAAMRSIAKALRFAELYRFSTGPVWASWHAFGSHGGLGGP
jgi:hypothetical protein